MTPLVSICLVVVTLSVAAIALAVVRALMRVERVADQLTRLAAELQEWTVGARRLTQETHEVIESVRGLVVPVRRVVDRFEVLAHRTAGLSEVVLGELEPPIRVVVAATRAVKSVSTHFIEHVLSRFSPGRTAAQEGFPHEPESAVQS